MASLMVVHSPTQLSAVNRCVVMGVLYFTWPPPLRKKKRVCNAGRSAKAKLTSLLQKAHRPGWVGKILRNSRV